MGKQGILYLKIGAFGPHSKKCFGEGLHIDSSTQFGL
jgi:hypothetical protein